MEVASLPKITVRQERSLYDIPEIAITFPDGRHDELILEKHFPNDEAGLENKEHCNYFGHLKNDLDACVAVTGCYGQDDLDFTIMSEHISGPNMFVLEKDGQVRAVENDAVFQIGQIKNEMESRRVGNALIFHSYCVKVFQKELFQFHFLLQTGDKNVKMDSAKQCLQLNY